MTTMALPQRRKRTNPIDLKRFLLPSLVLIAGMGIIAAYMGLKSFLASSYFDIKEVRWEGVKQLDSRELTEGFPSVLGKNLVYLNMAELHSTLVANPWIKEVVIRKVFPSRVDFLITERVPASVEIDPGTNNMVLRDGDGVVLEEMVPPASLDATAPAARRGAPASLSPTLLTPLQHPTHGKLPQMIHYNPAAYSKALELAPLVSERPDAILDISRPDDLAVYLKNGVVRAGDRDYKTRWNQFVKVEADLQQRGLTGWEADLRFPGRVVVRTGNADTRKKRS